MGSILTFLSLALLTGGIRHPSADTATYANAVTRALVERASARHLLQDSTVRSYQAMIRYRLSFAFGKRAWADLPTAAVEEQEGRISWQRPNDLRVDMLGRRSASQFESMSLTTVFNRPLFAPRGLGDSIRIFGLRTPVEAAPHPLSAGGARHYRFSAGEAITITSGGRPITIRSVTVTPKGEGHAYIAGKIWLDEATGDVVRLTFRFVGTGLWERPEGVTAEDSADAGRSNQFISRILQIDADLEYSLQENQYWMPYRQTISGRATVPFGIELAVPFEGSTTFSDYEINTGSAVVFTVPIGGRGGRGGGQRIPLGRGDSLRASDRVGIMPGGGRYQIHRPPADSLRGYTGWSDSLTLEVADQDRTRTREAVADLAAIIEELPRKMTGRPGAGIGLEKLGEAFRYNRVQGTTLSLSGRLPLPVRFTESFGTVRYGFADERIMASLSLRRDSPSSRWTLTGGRDLVDLDPFAKGLSFGNSIRAMLTGHDEGAYLLGEGIRLSYEQSVGLGRELTLTALAEQQQSVVARARAGVPRLFGNTGYFRAVPAVREGAAIGAGMRLENGIFATRWRIDAQVMAVDGQAAGRFAGDLSFPALVGGHVGLRVAGGAATSTTKVPQVAWYTGGVNTVRGFDFGTQSGAAGWATQFDLRPFSSRDGRLHLFVDAGQAASFATLHSTPVLVGAGAGLAFFGGLIRADLSHPVTQGAGQGVRFDLIFGGIP